MPARHEAGKPYVKHLVNQIDRHLYEKSISDVMCGRSVDEHVRGRAATARGRTQRERDGRSGQVGRCAVQVRAQAGRSVWTTPGRDLLRARHSQPPGYDM